MKTLVELYDSKLHEIQMMKIIIIANVRNKTDLDNKIVLNMAQPNEFFSEEEFDEIVDGIKLLRLYTKVYYNELDFIEDILNKHYKTDEIIVINFARNGVNEGKKSLIPAFCDLLGIKYSTSNAFVQSICRNKYLWGNCLIQENLPALRSYKTSDDLASVLKDNEKYIMKPVSESSSMNVSLVTKKAVLALKPACAEHYMLQKYLSGDEIEVPFFELNGKYYMFDPAKINFDGTVLDEAKSLKNDYYYSDCDLNGKQKAQLKSNAKKTAKILGIRKYGRIDYKLDEKGNAYIIDIATLPYITRNSSFAFSVEKAGQPYESIFKALIVIARESELN